MKAIPGKYKLRSIIYKRDRTHSNRCPASMIKDPVSHTGKKTRRGYLIIKNRKINPLIHCKTAFFYIFCIQFAGLSSVSAVLFVYRNKRATGQLPPLANEILPELFSLFLVENQAVIFALHIKRFPAYTKKQGDVCFSRVSQTLSFEYYL